MRKFIFIAVALTACVTLQAQTDALLMEEDFEYEAQRPLVSDPIDNMDNLDPVTGWSTAANSVASVNAFDIVEGSLSYPDYAGGVYGNALRYSGYAGQGVFKLFPDGICDDKDVYIAFLLKIEPTTDEITGGDYMMALKMEPAADSWNWGGRLYAKVDPAYPGEEVTFGIQKLSDCPIRWVNGQTGPFFPVNDTLLVVIKYHVGVIYGNNQDEEAGHFDDEMYLYVNPSREAEPSTAAITLIDSSAKDIYRWGTTRVFGSARGLYFRSADYGSIPAYVIDGIRVGRSWADVMGTVTANEEVSEDTKGQMYNAQKRIEDGEIIIYKNGRRFDVLGVER